MSAEASTSNAAARSLPEAPSLFDSDRGSRREIETVVEVLERGFNGNDADLADSIVAEDVLWGSPKGLIVHGLARLNPIHRKLKSKSRGFGERSRYTIESMGFLTPDIACAHVRRAGLDDKGNPLHLSKAGDAIVQEMALYLLVRHEGRWWIAAAQNTPVKPDAAATLSEVNQLYD